MNKITKGAIAVVSAVALSGAVSACGSDSDPEPTQKPDAPVTAPQKPEKAAEAPVEKAEKAPVKKEAPKPEKTTPEVTVSQEQAVQSAESYLDLGGFSKTGLIEQLSSEYGEGFSKADAEYAVENVEVDWNEQAVISAESYMEMGGFSRASLLDQLTSSYGEGFTQAQAEYAVNHVGL